VHGDVWFLAPPDRWNGDEVTLDEAESHHAIRVLRAASPDVITVFDGSGLLARCSIARIENDRVVAVVLERDRRPAPIPRIGVYQAAAKGPKNDEVIERLAELGVSDVTVFTSARSIVRWDEAKRSRLRERWSTIADSAAKQSRNPHVTRTGGPIGFDDVLERVANVEPLSVVLWEGADLPLRTALDHGVQRVALLIGPEGGFERTEAEALAEAGAQLVSLGPRIFRTEHAAAFASAAIMYHYGTLG
jgi:16S rRNA (uracil1498-N3)-methyltransferase